VTEEADLAIVVLAAGKGTRMKSDLPKVLHRLGGVPMISHVMAAASAIGAGRTVVVTGPGMSAVEQAVAPAPCVVQADQRGTADAVIAARPLLADRGGDILVLYGDTPLVTATALAAMRARRRDIDGPAIVVLGFRASDPGGYGRLLLDDKGGLLRIVEEKDANPAEKAITLCNSGIVLADSGLLWRLLAGVGNDNASGEYYLTDIIALAVAEGVSPRVVEASEAEVQGINSRAQLAAAEKDFQARCRQAAMAAGVTLIDPGSVWFSSDTVLGRDVLIEPGVFFGPGVTVGNGATIRAWSHLEGATLADGATVGPFVRLRPGADIGPGAKVGNFVEIKNAVLGKGAKASHLSYIGDADIGPGVNIGAGTITCNYDGFLKYRTTIGEGAFIGSNSALIAPVTVGAGAIVGAGSALSGDVPADALALTRAPQQCRDGWAAAFRRRKAREKAKKAG